MNKIFSFAAMSLQYVFVVLWVTVSVFYIEAGGYMSETRRFGYYTGAGWSYVFYVLVFFFMAYWAFRITQGVPVSKLTKKTSINGLVVTAGRLYKFLLFPIVFIMFFCGVMSEFPILSGIGRIAYWNEEALPGQRVLFNQLPLVAFIGGGFLFIEKSHLPSLLGIAKFISPVLIVQLVFGETFTGLSSSLFLFFVPFLAKPEAVAVIRKNIFKIGLMAFLVATLLLMYKFYGRYVSGIGSGLDLMLDRVFALQGQVWWSVYSLESYRETDMYDGMSLLMYIIAPSDVFNAYAGQGVNFTMGYPAILLEKYGHMALIPHALFGLGFGVIIGLVKVFVNNNKLFYSIILIKLYSFYMVVITSGNVSQIFSFKLYFYLLLLGIVFLVRRVSFIKT